MNGPGGKWICTDVRRVHSRLCKDPQLRLKTNNKKYQGKDLMSPGNEGFSAQLHSVPIRNALVLGGAGYSIMNDLLISFWLTDSLLKLCCCRSLCTMSAPCDDNQDPSGTESYSAVTLVWSVDLTTYRQCQQLQLCDTLYTSGVWILILFLNRLPLFLLSFLFNIPSF